MFKRTQKLWEVLPFIRNMSAAVIPEVLHSDNGEVFWGNVLTM
jgi:hypothetical protein